MCANERRYAAAVAWVAILILGPAHGLAFSSGPPDGRTGAPDELTCANGCHTSFVLNSGPGSVEIDAPSVYEPGMTYAIAVSVMQMGQMRWGFELTVLDDNGEQAGDLFSPDANTQVSASLGREYVKHTTVGTMAGQLDGNTFMFEWTAPEFDSGPITFYAAGNAANGDFTNQNDYIYTTSTQVPEPTGVASGLGVFYVLAHLGRLRRRSHSAAANT